MTAEKEKSRYISSADLGLILGKSDRFIQSLAKAEVITCKKEGNRNRYDLFLVIREYMDYLAKNDNKKYSSLEEQKIDEEVRLKRAKADMAELELAELKGSMHRSDDVEAAFNDLVFSVRNMLMALPGRAAINVSKAESAAEASAILRKECSDMLQELSGYQYDPEEYRKKVRERHGYEREIQEDSS